VWHKTLSPEQRADFARWVVGRLSKWMDRDEVLNVLTLGRKFAVKKNAPPKGAKVAKAFTRGKRKPGKWRSATGIQMVREVELGMQACGLPEDEMIKCLLVGGWRERFPKESKANIRRGYIEAKKWIAERQGHATDNRRKL
jgi:hypothetical protein